MAVRQHLMSLERKGIISYVTKKYGIGRPVFLYSLTEKANDIFPKTYRKFIHEVLGALEKTEGRKKVEKIFKLRKEGQLQERLGSLAGRQGLGERVRTLAEHLDKDGYMVELREGHGHFSLKQFNCLLYGVAEEYPEACKYELELYRDLLGKGVTRALCRREGDPACEYIIPVAT
jgi:predicted ArsR family transcriptional regulator